MEILRHVHRVADSMDNRFGMLNYDNLFWNKTWQNAIHAVVRAPGWYLGTMREYGGALSDIMHGNISHRLAFAISTPLVMALWSTIYQYARTGTVPQPGRDMWETWRNYMHPETGKLLANGEKERIQWASYTKDIEDVYGSLNDIWEGQGTGSAKSYLSGKINPWLTLMYSVLSNADWKNQEIRHKGDPLSHKLMQTAKFLGENLTPLGVQNEIKRRQLESVGENTGRDVVDSIMGLNVPKEKWMSTPFRNALYEAHLRRLPQGPYSAEEIQKRRYRHTLAAAIRKNPAQASALAKQFIQQGYLSLNDVKLAIGDASTDPLSQALKKGTLEDVLNNYDKAYPEEKARINLAIVQKFQNAPKSLTLPEYAKYRKQILHILTEEDKKKGP